MANVIAVIWDCDKTLIDGYMQDPIFRHFNVEAPVFWQQVEACADELAKKGLRVNRDTYYLNYFIRRAHDGLFPGLDSDMLFEFGKQQKLYPGIEALMKETKGLFINDKSYSEYGIRVEHYIVSTGFAQVIRGCSLMPWVDGVWGCELVDAPGSDGKNVISEVVYTIDNTTKTRAIFEINKGIGVVDGIDVNSKIDKEMRRVPFENMIYIADGPSDIPAFSLINQNGGATFAIYPKGDMRALQQVEQMRSDGRVDMYAEADYSAGTTAYMWLTSRIKSLADGIRLREQEKIRAAASAVPRHLNSGK